MDTAHQAMIAALKSIREQADSVLKEMERGAEQKSLSWKCVDCGHTKHFTRQPSRKWQSPLRNAAGPDLSISEALPSPQDAIEIR
jgi:hypothetical protein